MFLTYSSPSCINSLSLHDALPISFYTHSREDPVLHRVQSRRLHRHPRRLAGVAVPTRRHHGDELSVVHSGSRRARHGGGEDRKSTRLNSSHLVISYAVFCLKEITE